MKKARKIIPALAMLLVSAIMMSTASFAWFTMNEKVTATGMAIQAQATGSLVISKSELTYESGESTKADFTTATAPTLKPITWDSDAWKVAAGTDVDPFTGKLNANASLAAPDGGIDPSSNSYFIDNAIYIGSAGDTLYNQKLTINLKALTSANGQATKAYAAAIYVINPGDAYWEDDAIFPVTVQSADLEPVAIVHVDSLKDDANDANARNTVVLTGPEDTENDGYFLGYTIPSIVGVDNGNTTGLKVVIRLFIDGNLDALSADGVKATKNKDVISYEAVAADAKYNSQITYYTDEEGTIANTNLYTDGDDIPDTWRTRKVTATPYEYKYVNSADIPMTASTLEISFVAGLQPQYQASAQG